MTTITTTEHEHVGRIKLRHLSNSSQSQWPYSSSCAATFRMKLPCDCGIRLTLHTPHHTRPHPNTNTVARSSLLQCNPANSIHFHPLSLVLNTSILDPFFSCLLAGLRSNLTVACTRIAYSGTAIWMDRFCIVIFQVATICMDVDLNKTAHTA
jgi:hypothetical protein